MKSEQLRPKGSAGPLRLRQALGRNRLGIVIEAVDPVVFLRWFDLGQDGRFRRNIDRPPLLLPSPRQTGP